MLQGIIHHPFTHITGLITLVTGINLEVPSKKFPWGRLKRGKKGGGRKEVKAIEGGGRLEGRGVVAGVEEGSWQLWD